MSTKLKHIANIQTGVFAKTVAKGDLAYLQPKYFDEYGDLTTELELDLNSLGISENHILQKGDILFAAKGTRNFAAHYDLNISAAASTTFFVIRNEKPNILPEYVRWFINHPKTMTHLKKHARGSSTLSISKSVLEDLEIPIPSLKTQESILKIDSLRKNETQLRLKIEALREAQIQQQIFNAL